MKSLSLNTETIALYSKQLKTPSFNRYDDIIRQLDNDKSYEQFLIDLLKLESASRMESSQKRRISAAKFPYIKTFDEMDLSRYEHVSEATFHDLASCDFVSKRQNIVMIGNTGRGKTHCSIALGIKACMQGMNVKFYTAANLSNELIEAMEYKRILKLERQLEKIDLLIIDEASYITFNRHQSELLFKVIADRAEKRSVIVSTNLKFSEWPTLFENETMVAALIDRLTFRSHVLNMNGQSFRSEYTKEHSKEGAV
ncbi:IS21-like element helper ATPase IstB [Clostridium lacusfryxellense]|uniref:IS21-like element helper ATPase IstB n=1 Tax=Clostridium lacusfryxellense TaxID=205328 RepID=UPI001C0CD1C2|nr:IS21-like element helper ATPase IstB [Clostridium lacusfryxellense]MBU3114830.1 IS21-like element helper ATPase IstB [Clostridium lacusfryxellense]